MNQINYLKLRYFFYFIDFQRKTLQNVSDLKKTKLQSNEFTKR